MKKSVTAIKAMYVDLISGAPDQIKMGPRDILFIYLYLFVKGKASRQELIEKMKETGISGLAMAYLIEEVERHQSMLNKYKLPDKYGL